jgi:hypothetical protein
MLILNFTHPLTSDQRAQIEALAHVSIEEVRTVHVQIDQAEPLEPQIVTIVDAVGLSSEEWQTRALCRFQRKRRQVPDSNANVEKVRREIVNPPT